MSKILLISSNTTTEPYPVYPLGLAVIASASMAQGHHVRQFDWLAEGKSEGRLQSIVSVFQPDFIGLSLRNIDNVDSFDSERSWYLAEARKLVLAIRKKTDSPIIAGGPAFSIMPEEILEYLDIRFGIAGEGEKAFFRLIQSLENGSHSSRIITTDGDQLISGDEISSPFFSEDLIRFYAEQSGMISLQTKRGCPHRCIYCTYPALEGKQLRPRNPEAVIEDIRRLTDEFGVRTIAFTDSVFNDASGHYLAIAEELLAKGIHIRWSAFFRPQGTGRKELHLLKRSGLYAAELGTDGACDKTLLGLNKGFHFTDVAAFNDACNQEKIPCAHFIMFGGPGETEKTVKEGLENIKRLQHCVIFAFSGIRLLPKTGLLSLAILEGVRKQAGSLLKPDYYFSPQINMKRMNDMIKRSFAKRRDRIFPPSEGQLRLNVMARFGFRGLLWDQLIRY